MEETMEDYRTTAAENESLIRAPIDSDLAHAVGDGRLKALVFRGDVREIIDPFLGNDYDVALIDRKAAADEDADFEDCFLGRASLDDWECCGAPGAVWEAYASLLPPKEEFLALLGPGCKVVTLYTLLYFDPAF